MANYLFTYHGGSMPSDEEAEQDMKDWTNWMNDLGDAVVDGGNPVGRAATVSAGGTVDTAPTTWIGGYSVIKADTFDEAIDWAKRCPHLKFGGSVEVDETFEVM